MIQDDIINELQYIPEAKLIELYDIIHYFRLGLTSEAAQQSPQEEEFKIDKQACLDALAKIKRGDTSGLTEIVNVDDHINELKEFVGDFEEDASH